MRYQDLIKLALSAVSANRTRTLLTTLGIAIGIAAVVILSAIGQGMQQYVLGQFTQFGSNLIAVSPGKQTTFGISGAIINNVRPLSLEDNFSLGRLHGIIATVPVVQGNAAVEYGNLSRRTTVLGTSSEVGQVWQMQTATGRFLPKDAAQQARAQVVIGSKIRQELFASENPLGKRLRIAGESFVIIGVMQSKGQLLGFDLDDTVYIPVQKAMSMFNQNSLMEIDLLYHGGQDSEALSERIRTHLINRHGAEDFTVTTQDQMLGSLDTILTILTTAVAALGGISLLVGGFGILTIMTIAVSERRNEIGLLTAIGMGKWQVLTLFLVEAALLGLLGGVSGLVGGVLIAVFLDFSVNALPVHINGMNLLLAEASAILIGLVAGVWPAWQATQLNPVDALRTE